MTSGWIENPRRDAETPQISVVLPCLDEVGSVGSCVAEAIAAMVDAGLTGEVVVVDNGSTDGSDEVAVAAGARLVYEARSGYGSALAAGIEASRGQVVVMADADSSYDLSRIPALAGPVLDGTADLVIGSRLGTATRDTMPLAHRFVGTPAITFLIARASGGRSAAKDSQSGFRAFRRDDFARLRLQSPGMEFASEMLIRATHAGWRVQEVPTGYRPRVGRSKLNTLSDGWRHLLLILSLAPDLLPVGPGAALMAVGIVLSVLSLLSPGGISLGSLQWQPVFFSTIALVLGTQALLAGTVLAYRLSVISGSVCTRFAFAGGNRFAFRCVVAGSTSMLVGLGIDLVLFVVWSTGRPALSRSLALAALAQSLLIVGASVALFALVSLVLVGRVGVSQAPEAPSRRGLAGRDEDPGQPVAGQSSL
ncbi:MAG: hypothetical protein QOJ69_1190 [Actinomycetota bacterium]|nr:hypothetical protein [Actinomycetota bacterium]